MRIAVRLVISAVALWVTTLIPPLGIDLTGPTDEALSTTTLTKVGTLFLVAVIFGIVNAVLQPIIKRVGCMFYVLTLGLVGLLVNGALFMLTSYIAGQLNLPFTVAHFWPGAVLGALLVGLVSWVLDLIVPDGD